MVKQTSTKDTVSGYCDPAFQDVLEAFRDNLLHRNEIGASVSVVYQGKTVVDLWGGFKDRHKTQAWEKDTLVCVMSVTKAIATLGVLKLADEGRISLDKPIAEYWPEFAQNGKAAITVRCLLSQLAGLPVAEAALPGSLFENDSMMHALEIQKPTWPPGSTPCYHSFTYGPLCQALVLKCTGKTLGRYLTDLFTPLDIEFYLGMGEAEISRCAEMIIPEGVPTLEQVKDPQTLIYRAWQPLPQVDDIFNDAGYRRNEFASGSGHSNARHLARLFGHLSSAENPLLSQRGLEDAITEQWNGLEKMTQRHFRYSSGFMLNNPYFRIGPNPRSFGHPGLGGANAFADPDAHIGFGYAGNYVHPINHTGPCASALIEAVYNSL